MKQGTRLGNGPIGKPYKPQGKMPVRQVSKHAKARQQRQAAKRKK